MESPEDALTGLASPWEETVRGKIVCSRHRRRIFVAGIGGGTS